MNHESPKPPKIHRIGSMQEFKQQLNRVISERHLEVFKEQGREAARRRWGHRKKDDE